MQNWLLTLPEILVLTMTCGILLAEVFQNPHRPALSYWLAQATLSGALIVTLWLTPSQKQLAFNGVFVHDTMATVLKSFILIVTSAVFVYSRHYLAARDLLKGEYFVLGLFAVLGMMVMASAHSFLTVYLGLELLSLSLYSMVAMHRDSREASEAAIKYFVLGALASGMLLYGMSMLYGVTGSLDLTEIAHVIGRQSEDSGLFVFGLVFVVAGIAFKLGAVPFHMWIPDVYHGAPTSVTLFISTAPELAAFAMAIRLLVDGLDSLVASWQGMLVILALLSMATGNIIAIAQSNIKRMLAYSTIAHMGFLLLGLLAGTRSGYAGAMFYVISYALMSSGAFGMIILLGRTGFEADRIEDFKGLAERSPWFGLIMLMLMFSLAGVPPFIGFWAKWFVIKEAINAGFIGLAVVAVITSIIGAYYYLRIVKLMYFDPVEQREPIMPGAEMRWVISLNGLILLVLGLMPGLLMGMCIAAMGG
jgi:NADH-quinone oxidoreductase subunit N